MQNESLSSSAAPKLASWRLRAMRRIVRLLPRGRNLVLARWARTAGPLPEVVCETAYGFKMAINLKEQLARDIFFNGVYEPVTAAVIAHLLQPGDVFFDVGEERGQFSLGFHPFAIIQQKGPKVDDFCRNRINLNPGMISAEIE